MKFLIAILVVAILIIPLLLFLARRIYRDICLAKSRTQAQGATDKFELIIRFLLIDVLIIVTVAIFIHDLIKGGF